MPDAPSPASPRVSVVIPTFGRPALLAKAVGSVLAQTMDDLELIVVVDGRDPATLAYLSGIADPRIRYIAHHRKRGAGETRDAGAEAAQGEWVAFLDDDDEWLPEKLERQLAIAPSDGRAVVMTQSHVVTPAGNFVRPLEPFDQRQQSIDEWLFDRSTWLKGGLNFLQTSSLMMPRAMFDVLHFRDTRQHEEWELVIRAVNGLGYRLLTVVEPLVIHYAGQPRPSLSKTYTRRHSLDWIDGMKNLVTPRAYSGFVLLHVGQQSANLGQWGALLPLLGKAARRGRPTAKQLFRFATVWAMPMSLRRRARATVQRNREDVPIPSEMANSAAA